MTESPPSVAVITTPVGPMTAFASADALLSLRFGERAAPTAPNRVLDRLADELGAYFAGELRDFATPLDAAGTPFQRRVWRVLGSIPFGETRSYAAVAKQVGAPRASRAVGAANGANPIAILAPCHRVVRTGGALGGYAGGLAIKRRLLAHEAAVAGRVLFA